MFYKGQHVRTNEHGRTYYTDERQNLAGVVVIEGHVTTHVKRDDGRVFTVYTDQIELSEEENT